MESWVGLGRKEGRTNIPISAELRLELGTLWMENRDLTNCTNHARPGPITSAGVAAKVGKIFAFWPQGPEFDPDFAEIWTFGLPSFLPQLSQLSILLGYVNKYSIC